MMSDCNIHLSFTILSFEYINAQLESNIFFAHYLQISESDSFPAK